MNVYPGRQPRRDCWAGPLPWAVLLDAIKRSPPSYQRARALRLAREHARGRAIPSRQAFIEAEAGTLLRQAMLACAIRQNVVDKTSEPPKRKRASKESRP